MEIGISTACFYPQDTLAALMTLCEAQVPVAEVFINTFSELEPPYTGRLQAQIERGPTRVCSLHPFSSGMETFFFASMYEGRMGDGLALYRKYFALCKACGIPRLVFHGDYKQTPFPFRKHCACFAQLRDVGREYGVELCQENVVRCKCGTPDYILQMRELLNDDVSFVLDLKQMRRAGVQQEEMLRAMEGHISHVHISDFTATHDCAVPFAGDYDYVSLLRALKAQGYTGDLVIELYRGDFTDLEQLCGASARLRDLAKTV